MAALQTHIPSQHSHQWACLNHLWLPSNEAPAYFHHICWYKNSGFHFVEIYHRPDMSVSRFPLSEKDMEFLYITLCILFIYSFMYIILNFTNINIRPILKARKRASEVKWNTEGSTTGSNRAGLKVGISTQSPMSFPPPWLLLEHGKIMFWLN